MNFASRRVPCCIGFALLLFGCSGGETFFDVGPRDAGSRSDGDPMDVADDVVSGPDVTSDGVTPGDIGGIDAVSDVPSGDAVNLYDTVTGSDACAGEDGGSCAAGPTGCVGTERCDNGLDDNCNGAVDEGCACLPGTVQDCFLGPPARRGVGACRPGTQRCAGSTEFGTWGPCTGGISPTAEACDNLDNDCDGCVDQGLCCRPELTCPRMGDSRVPDGAPFVAYPLRGELFYAGPARSWTWTVRGGPCDTILPRPTYTLSGDRTRSALFTPSLSGDYTVTFTVVTMDGRTLTCTFIVHIAGPGLRIELCWDTSTSVDLDLYLHDPRNTNPWFSSAAGPLTSVTNASCNWSNCEANLRGTMGRVSWSYAISPLSECRFGPLGSGWVALGYCANPRLDIDNNLVKASGTPENINVDRPRDAERFRIMVQNFTGAAARPIVNVYCGGHLRATLGAGGDAVADFTGGSGYTSVGAMWRPADVTVRVDSTGATTGCDVAPLHPPGATVGPYVTRGDPSY